MRSRFRHLVHVLLPVLLSCSVLLSSVLMLGGCGYLTVSGLSRSDEEHLDVGAGTTASQRKSETSAEEPEGTGEDAAGSSSGSDMAVIIYPVDGFGQGTINHAQSLLDKMTLEEKVGQLFIINGLPENASSVISSYTPGGILLGADAFAGKSKDEVKEAMSKLQQASGTQLFLAVAEEGGTEVAVSANTSLRPYPFWSQRDFVEKKETGLIGQDATEKSILLRSLGLNMNLAPVCDISVNKTDFMYSRSYGTDASQTAGYITDVVTKMGENKIVAVLKHFPGQGGVAANPYEGPVYDDRALTTFTSSEYMPFKAGIAAGAGVVMMSHNTVTAIDPDNPASLSSDAHAVLRQDLSFTGLIMTDEMTMGAIDDFADRDAAAIQAIRAGNDLILTKDYGTQIPAVIAAVESGMISEEMLNHAVLRVLCTKIAQGIIV